MTNKEALRNLLYCKYEISKSEFVAHLKFGTVRLAIIALGKQIPKKPFRCFQGDDDEWFDCPTCGKTLYHQYEYCSCCGQKIDWSEEE